MTKNTNSSTEKNIIVLCENCFQKLRLPKLNKKLRVTCPTCRHEFNYKYNILGFSPSSKKYLMAGLVGGIAGFALVEIAQVSFLFRIGNILLSASLAIGTFGTCLGAVMGAAEGFFKKNRERLYYGLKAGTVLGLVSGLIAGLIAQIVFSTILGPESVNREPSLGLFIFARTVGWCVLGLLIGLAYGIKENTSGDLKFGLIGGAIGGAIGGVLFDPLSFLISLGGGTLGRLVGFTVLGMAVCVSINRFREIALSSNRPEMYRQLTRKLPTNPRLSLPSASTKESPLPDQIERYNKEFKVRIRDAGVRERLIKSYRGKYPQESEDQIIKRILDDYERDNR